MMKAGIAAMVVGLLVAASVAPAQFTTTTVNGTVAAGEYGTHTNGQNQLNNGTQTWYMTWNDTHLFVGITSANVAEGAVLYIDRNPIAPVNGGSASDGSITGQPYDRTTAVLPFRGDFVCYFKNTYHEYRTANGSGGWSSATASTLNVSTSGGTREISIPWSAITGGSRPASFNWMGYIVYDGGAANNGVYSPMPTENQAGAFNVSATTTYNRRYFTVSTTGDGTSTKPFNRKSYSYVHTISQTGFGTLNDIHDFTMNAPGFSITRATGGGNPWTFTGNFRVDGGTINCADSSTPITVAGDCTITTPGILNLSTAAGGDLVVAGNYSNTGTVNHNGRTAIMNGTGSQTISAETFAALVISNTTGTQLGGNVAVNGALTLSGTLTLQGYDLTHSGAASGSASGFVVTNSGGRLNRPAAAGLPYTFHVGPNASSYNPVEVDQNSGNPDTISVGVDEGLAQGTALQPSQIVDRTWHVERAGVDPIDLDLAFVWSSGHAGGSIDNSAVGWRWNGSTWVNQGGTTVGAGPFTTTVSGVTQLSEWAVGNPLSLPVTVSHFAID